MCRRWITCWRRSHERRRFFRRGHVSERGNGKLRCLAALVIAGTLAALCIGKAPAEMGKGVRETPHGVVTPSKAVQAFWDRVQHCEEPVTGWKTRGSTYSGGVGFYNRTFTSWEHELGYHYPNAADAPRLVQIQVAEYGYTVHHGYWGCIANRRF